MPPADVRPLPPPYAHGEMGSPAAEFGVDGPGDPRKSGSGRVMAQLTFINGIIMNYNDIYIYMCIDIYMYIYTYIYKTSVTGVIIPFVSVKIVKGHKCKNAWQFC
jgi:hypothetical protein